MVNNTLNKNLDYLDRENLEKIIGPSLKNYNNHIVDLILSIESNKSEILDFGAGCGSLAKIVRKKTNQNLTCIEIDEYFISILIKEGFDVFDNHTSNTICIFYRHIS